MQGSLLFQSAVIWGQHILLHCTAVNVWFLFTGFWAYALNDSLNVFYLLADMSTEHVWWVLDMQSVEET